ncbi:DUF1932 domain-containing protein [Leucobacter allii]|uniref:DUF1932 domain-containing protein n=1 Tax=Leucobacter allii TaxID=2932247 RepID=UPI0024B6190F|nr:DUF1932 domain-containing protein [Leucobacter allii]
MTHIAILGLGEAGRRYAVGLASASPGAAVVGYDPFVTLADPAFAAVATQEADLHAALAEADLVLSLTGARAAAAVAAEALPHLRPGAILADLNTGSPELKERISAEAAAAGVRFADAAVLAPVPRAGHRTPLAASGTGAEAFAALMTPLGAPVEVVGARAGDAARLKLLRSVFMKGLAALVIEGLTAAAAQDAEPWLRAQIAAELGPGGDALVERLVTGTRAHAERREHEVRDALDVLESGGLPADMTRATLAWFERILAEHPAP